MSNHIKREKGLFPVDMQCSKTSLLKLPVRLRVVPHFSSGIVERAKRERAWKSPYARKGGDFHARSRFARSTILEGKWGTTPSLSTMPCFSWVRCLDKQNWTLLKTTQKRHPGRENLTTTLFSWINDTSVDLSEVCLHVSYLFLKELVIAIRIYIHCRKWYEKSFHRKRLL